MNPVPTDADKSDSPLLRALCVALARHPRLTLQQLATQAGISKATLYRLASTRDALVELLYAYAGRVGMRTFDRAGLEERPVLQALRDLTSELLANRECYAFALTYHWVKALDGGSHPDADEDCQYYERRVAAFFERGQREGVFRADLPAIWLAKSYNSLLYGVVDAEQSGTVTPAQMQRCLEALFLEGAAPAAGADGDRDPASR